jgi:hypothetical protein
LVSMFSIVFPDLQPRSNRVFQPHS